MMGEYMPPYRDFNLGERGVKYIYPDVQAAYIGKNHKPVMFYLDPKKTAQYLSAHFNKEDGKRYEQMYSGVQGTFRENRHALTYMPAMPAMEQVPSSRLSTASWARDSMKYRNDTAGNTGRTLRLFRPIKAALYNLFAMWGHSNYDGLGFLFPLIVYRMLNAALVSGGSHRLSSALACKSGTGGGR